MLEAASRRARVEAGRRELRCAEQLAAAGLLSPEVVLDLDVGDLGNALKAAGYDRGGVTYIIAPRLRALMAEAKRRARRRARPVRVRKR